ncbi:sulfite exporter TauE/SafE family protein [bacterium]|nr:MAG: sulfite exporter TauE/SafE family protein [bacterium]
METGLLVAFSTGLLGGFGHCIGMCGPIVASYALHNSSEKVFSRIASHILYNTGRITTYMFIGALMGLTGAFVNVAGRLTGLQNVVAILAGLFMVLMGLSISGLFGAAQWLESQNSLIMKAAKGLSYEKSLWRYYPLGALFGFLPCGLSYTVFIAAAGTGDLFSGMLLAVFFGLGTFPSLFLFGITASLISSQMRGLLYRFAGFMIIGMGIYFLVKGLELYGSL